MKKFWMVYCASNIGRTPVYKHETLNSAIEEAHRLALKQRGDRFFILETIGVASTPDTVNFEKIED